MSPCGTYGAANLCGAHGTKVAMQSLTCTGEELSLSDCTWSTPSDGCLTHDQDSIVHCGPSSASPVEGSVRLLSSDGAPSLSGHGLVEVFVQDAWSPVCGISSGAQALLCKVLGFSGAGSSSRVANDVAHSLPSPRMGSLDCNGSEVNVLGCSFEAEDDVYCAPSEASMISCA